MADFDDERLLDQLAEVLAAHNGALAERLQAEWTDPMLEQLAELLKDATGGAPEESEWTDPMLEQLAELLKDATGGAPEESEWTDPMLEQLAELLSTD